MNQLPQHLRRYIVDQNYSKYTPVDQAVWRFILRQLKAFLQLHAHEAYLDGLEKTGISIEEIPKISEISSKLEKFGWRALPVSGFIPPAAFMELQSLSVLPIATDLRSLDHLLYTPAPDIVHEAAGHAPFLAHPLFAKYLREYAHAARLAIISREDLALYEAIRSLSDVKEHPDSKPEQIDAAQQKLDEVAHSMSHVSEAAELGRMNWWTAEYGLIGDLQNPKIFGAGLLSSVGESRWCLSDKVRKIPLTVDCIKQSYDITEPQPQLFVTPNFEHLSLVLKEMAKQMAFSTGGVQGLQKALRSKTVNSFQWNSGLQASGELEEILLDSKGEAAFIRLKGPSQLCFGGAQIEGHSKTTHAQGFSSPIGLFAGKSKCLSEWSSKELNDFGIRPGSSIDLNFESGVLVQGVVKGLSFKNNLLVLLHFVNPKVRFKDRVLFEPQWGEYDMAVGSRINSVFGGPADRAAYGETEDFVAIRIPPRAFSEAEKLRQALFEQLRSLRAAGLRGEALLQPLQKLLTQQESHFPQEWLFQIEALELVCNRTPSAPLEAELRERLERQKARNKVSQSVIEDGLKQAHWL